MRIIIIGISFLLILIGSAKKLYGQSFEPKTLTEAAEAIRQEGHIFFNDKKYELALLKYKEALNKFTAIPDSIGIAKCYNNMGNSQLFLGNNEEAVSAFYSAIKINKLLNNNKALIGNCINLAAYYLKQKELDLALKYYLEAKDQVAVANDPLRLPMIYLGLATILANPKYKANDYRLAKKYYHKALEKYIAVQDSSRISAVYNNLGILLSNELKFDSSLYYYKQSLSLDKLLSDSNGQIVSHLNVGNIYMEQGNYGIALDYFTKGADLAIDFDDEVNYHHLITNILKCKIKLGELDQADSLFAIYNSLNDSIYNQEKAKNLKELEVLYETQKMGNDLKDQIKQTEAKTRLSYWYLAMAIGVALLLIITVLYFIQRQKYQQSLKVQEINRLSQAQEIKELNAMMQGQEEERNRIAEDLHDRLGARLSTIKLFTLKKGQKNLVLAEMVEAAIKETREISHNLSTDMLTKFGLQNAVSDFIRSVNESNKIEGDFTTTNLEERLPKIYEKTIFHIILELVNNTIRHSGASSFFIQLTRYKNEIDLIYEDDGKGFDAKQTAFKGMGIKNLIARVESIKGKINIDSKPGKGINVVMSASLNDYKPVKA
ncbi:MAG: sensor histidine kinase [Cyclobacteriaceae bacterium]|nr:sensor histidine kinase [Cyclobacteriaceae bacterium]